MEQWATIKEFPNYAVSTFGAVMNKRNGKIVTTSIRDGYITVQLGGNGRRRNVHRLIALAFIDNPDPENKILVDHRDRVRGNNAISNLRWATTVENRANRVSGFRTRVSLASVEKIAELVKRGMSTIEIHKKINMAL